MRWLIDKILKRYDRRKRYDIESACCEAFFDGMQAGRQDEDLDRLVRFRLTQARNFARDKLNDKYGDFEYEDGEWSELIKILDRSL